MVVSTMICDETTYMMALALVAGVITVFAGVLIILQTRRWVGLVNRMSYDLAHLIDTLKECDQRLNKAELERDAWHDTAMQWKGKAQATVNN